MQLKHEPKETSGQVHGFARVLNSNGKVLAEQADLQHNRNYGSRRDMAVKLAEQVGAPVEAGGTEELLSQGDSKKKTCPSACCVLQ